MNHATLERNQEEIAEIEKHKYFLSEEAGYDVGWEVAEKDWESKHGECFRQSIRSDSQSTPKRKSGTLFRRLLAKARRR
jgi:hypothetical protein